MAKAALTPAAVEAAASKAQCRNGTATAEACHGPLITDQQHAGTTNAVSGPSPLRSRRIAKAPPHP
jgi:hypothetical protein